MGGAINKEKMKVLADKVATYPINPKEPDAFFGQLTNIIVEATVTVAWL